MKILILVSTVFILCLTFVVNAQTNVQRYESVNGLFTVLLPGVNPPENGSDDSQMRSGQVVRVDGKTRYSITYRCSCEMVDNPVIRKAFFSALKRNVVTGKGIEIISERDIHLDLKLTDSPKGDRQYNGHEFIAVSNTEKITYRAFFANSRVYEVKVISPKDQPESPETIQFWGSFKPVESPKYLPSHRKAGEPDTVQSTEAAIRASGNKLVVPSYPPQARNNHVEGRLLVRILIDTNGKVISTEVLCGNPVFVRAVTDAAKASTFRPSAVNGVPVQITGVLTYNFTVNTILGR